jgi:hypothetical protein
MGARIVRKRGRPDLASIMIAQVIEKIAREQQAEAHLQQSADRT